MWNRHQPCWMLQRSAWRASTEGRNLHWSQSPKFSLWRTFAEPKELGDRVSRVALQVCKGCKGQRIQILWCEQSGWGNLSLYGFRIPYWLYRGNMLGFCSSQPLLAQFTGVSKHQQKAMVKLHKMVKVWKRHLKVSHSAVYLFLCSRLWLWLLIWGSASNQLRLYNVHFAICNVTL